MVTEDLNNYNHGNLCVWKKGRIDVLSFVFHVEFRVLEPSPPEDDLRQVNFTYLHDPDSRTS